MAAKNYLISVITVCFNCRDTIEKTIGSVINQTYSDIEFIIIDGGSTDGTIDIINTYHQKISLIISEKDAGIYDAMNKGFAHSHGDIIYFLNSGDLLANSDTIEKIHKVFQDCPGVALVFGDIIEYGEHPDRYCSMYHESLIQYFPQAICHQAIFSRRCAFEKGGIFDLRYPIFADRDWIFRCIFLNNLKIQHIPKAVCNYLTGGGSSFHNKKFYWVRTLLLLKYLTNPRMIVLLVRNPKVFGLSIVLFIYSFIKTILLSLFNRRLTV